MARRFLPIADCTDWLTPLTARAMRRDRARTSTQETERREHQRRPDCWPRSDRFTRVVHARGSPPRLRTKHRRCCCHADDAEQDHAGDPRTLARERTRALIEQRQVLLQPVLRELHATLRITHARERT